MSLIVTLIFVLFSLPSGEVSENLVPDGGFESWKDRRPEGWSSLWTREAGAGSVSLDPKNQQTVFSNGVSVTVNFGDAPFRTENGVKIVPLGFRVTGARE